MDLDGKDRFFYGLDNIFLAFTMSKINKTFCFSKNAYLNLEINSKSKKIEKVILHQMNDRYRPIKIIGFWILTKTRKYLK